MTRNLSKGWSDYPDHFSSTDDAGKLELPALLRLEAHLGAETVVLLPDSFVLDGARAEFLIFLLELVELFQQSLARRDGVTGFLRELMGGTSQAEEREEHAPERDLQLRGSLPREIEDNHRQQCHGTESYVMRTSKHSSPDLESGRTRVGIRFCWKR